MGILCGLGSFDHTSLSHEHFPATPGAGSDPSRRGIIPRGRTRVRRVVGALTTRVSCAPLRFRLERRTAQHTTRHGTARHGHSTAEHGHQHGTSTARNGTARHGTARHDTTRYATRHSVTTDARPRARKSDADIPSSFAQASLGRAPRGVRVCVRVCVCVTHC